MRFCGWLECVMFGLLLLTCKKVAWNDWMKQVGEMKHIFKLSFLGHASIIFNAWDVIWKLHLWTFRIWFYLFQKIAEKALKTRSKLSVARANENLVAPLSIVLTQSCMNYEHWVVHQMKVENHIFPFMYNLLCKYMIMITKNCIESRFRFFWDALYI